MAFINIERPLNLAGIGSRKVALRRALVVLLGMLLAAGVAGCGQPPPSNDAAGGAPEGETTVESGDTTGEVTEETTTEETTAVEVGGSLELAEAAEGYEEYVVEQTALLEDRTRGFTDAVISGDVEKAKALYAPARVPWERIEPVAAQFGDYDPRIDAREDDVPRDEWQGFHRIAKALWVEGTT